MIPLPSRMVRGARTQMGMSQAEFAAALGVSRHTVNELENERRTITADMAVKLEVVTKVNAREWLQCQLENDLATARADAAVVSRDPR